jgi:hypothetical protein
VIMKRFFYIFFVVVFGSWCSIVFSQTQEVKLSFKFHIFDLDTKKDVVKLPVNIFVNDTLIKTINTDESGKFSYLFYKEKSYKIVFTATADYIEKIILIDTRNIDYLNWKYKKEDHVNIPYDIESSMIKPKNKCQDFTFLKTIPVMDLRYDPKTLDFFDFSKDELITRIKKEMKKKCA